MPSWVTATPMKAHGSHDSPVQWVELCDGGRDCKHVLLTLQTFAECVVMIFLVRMVRMYLC